MIPPQGSDILIFLPWACREMGVVNGGRYFDQDKKHFINVRLDSGVQIINVNPDDVVVF